MRRTAAGIVVGTLAVLGSSVPASGAVGSEAHGAVAAEIRVNQQGYLPSEHKLVVLMAPSEVDGTWEVQDSGGGTVLSGVLPARSSGSWNVAFPAVYRLDLVDLQTPGSFRLVVSGDVSVTSPEIAVIDPQQLWGELLDKGVAFDQAQRDGVDVIAGDLDRRPAHLRDRRASVFRWPRMVRGEDLITDRDLHRTGGPVDVEGGWADAGDYLKFTHSAAYNDVLLFTSARLLEDRAPRALLAEARFGERWLAKMWSRRAGTLHLQVGIGSGNRAGTFAGDHDLWRLPQADDGDTRRVDRFVRRRPVFDAAPAGSLTKESVTGRHSADDIEARARALELY